MMKLNTFLPWDFWMETRGLEGNTNFLDSENSWKIEVLVPGWTSEDIEVELESGILNIKNRPETQDRSGMIQENFKVRPKIHERIKLPVDHDPDRIQAEVKNGVLTVTIPKKTTKISIL